MGGTNKRPNCWEFKKCGKEPGGPNASAAGTCPAATLSAADGTNGGVNGGRVCWAVVGTLCGGKPVGMFAQKIVNCMNCEFYVEVKEEEGRGFKFTK